MAKDIKNFQHSPDTIKCHKIQTHIDILKYLDEEFKTAVLRKVN